MDLDDKCSDLVNVNDCRYIDVEWPDLMNIDGCRNLMLKGRTWCMLMCVGLIQGTFWIGYRIQSIFSCVSLPVDLASRWCNLGWVDRERREPWSWRGESWVWSLAKTTNPWCFRRATQKSRITSADFSKVGFFATRVLYGHLFLSWPYSLQMLHRSVF